MKRERERERECTSARSCVWWWRGRSRGRNSRLLSRGWRDGLSSGKGSKILPKCHVHHLGRGNKECKYTTTGGVESASVEEEKDVGVMIHHTLRPSL